MDATEAGSDCLAVDAGECLEEQMEEVEEQLIESMSKSLLQVKLQHSRAPRSVEAADSADAHGIPVNCSRHPMFCHPEVNCADAPITTDERAAWDMKLATEDGHANLRSWCMVYPKYTTPLQKCVLERDPKGYSQEAFAAQKKANLVMADAVYCFVAGHCNNTAVTASTTMLEAEAICDAKYGHDRWTNVGFREFVGVLNRAQRTMAAQTQNLLEHRSSWADLVHLARHESDISAMTACAMGNYHCDVVYCQDHYCHDESYARFAKLSWRL